MKVIKHMNKEEKLQLNIRKLCRERVRGNSIDILFEYGKDILTSNYFEKEKEFPQHGDFSVYEHSIAVTILAINYVKKNRISVDISSLVRGSLLHDYFLYDWHKKPHPKHHANLHSEYAFINASRDFELNILEQSIIRTHMWPLHFFFIPSTREAWIVNVCDTKSALKETLGSKRIKKDIALIEKRIEQYKNGEENKMTQDILILRPQF